MLGCSQTWKVVFGLTSTTANIFLQNLSWVRCNNNLFPSNFENTHVFFFLTVITNYFLLPFLLVPVFFLCCSYSHVICPDYWFHWILCISRKITTNQPTNQKRIYRSVVVVGFSQTGRECVAVHIARTYYMKIGKVSMSVKERNT